MSDYEFQTAMEDEPSIGMVLVEIRDALRELVAIAKARRPVVWPGERTIASDAELDHPKYGDPQVKTAPRDWTGDFRVGQRMSESDPRLLDLVAERSDYFAGKNDQAKAVTDKGVPKSKFDRANAAKARGWAARLRKAGPKAPEPVDELSAWRTRDFA